MARTYRRDSRGRFSSGGGSARGVKATTAAGNSRSINTARAKQLKAAGTTAIGGRVKAKGFAGGKAAQQRAGGLRGSSTRGIKRATTAMGAGTRLGMKSNAASIQKARSKMASKGVKKMSKAPVSAAKAKYKELSSAARRSGAYRSAAENRAAAGAKRSMRAMEKKRGVSGRKRAKKK